MSEGKRPGEVTDKPTSFDVEAGILLVTVTGRFSRDEAFDTQAGALDRVRLQNLHRILVDMRKADVDVTTLDIFDLATSFAQTFPRGIRHAVVFSPDSCSPRDATFGENVTVNRGIAMKTFTQINEAKDWLLGDKIPT